MPRRNRNRPVRFEFDDAVPFDEVQSTLELARMAASGLFGRECVDLQADVQVDGFERTIAIDRSTDAGGALAAIFLKYCRCEFGEEAIRMRRMGDGKPDGQGVKR